jgi:hypothetical protein
MRKGHVSECAEAARNAPTGDILEAVGIGPPARTMVLELDALVFVEGVELTTQRH